MRYGVLLLLVALFSTTALASDLRAYFDRKSVYEGDTVTLIIETTGNSLGEPDLSGLGTDFELLGTSQSTNISIVNGRRTDTIRFLVTLAPQRTGTIEVPPIPVGVEHTGSLRLEVGEVPEGGTGSGGDDIFVELDVGADSGELMVQQQVPLTVRLFTAAPLLKGSLSDPRAEGALVTKLGEDREYSTQRNGRAYQVVERRYTLSAERSGELRIAPVRFEGSVRSNDGRRGGSRGSLFDNSFLERFFENGPLSSDPFGMFDSGRPVSARSRGIDLAVQARPSGYSGAHWLPAEGLEIQDSWADDPPALRVGEPVTRTLTIQAKGLSGPQIPEIEIAQPSGLRVYPEKGESDTRSDGETVYGISRQGVTLIPTRAGELTIPELRVTWWDTVAQQERITKVPGWTLGVTAGSDTGTVPQPAVPAAEQPGAEAQDTARDQGRQATADADGVEGSARALDRRYAMVDVIIVLALIFVGIWAQHRYRRSRAAALGPSRSTQSAGRNGPRIDASEARKALHVACDANDARSAAKALLSWAEATWPRTAPRDLATLGERLACGVDEVRALEKNLYSPESGSWNGAALWQALRAGLSDATDAGKPQAVTLEPLYPHRADRS